MLDAYIIDRIRREQEQARIIDRRQPLQIERPGPPSEDERRPDGSAPNERSPGEERGSVVIDYSL